jgi:hypothetical protein
MTYHAYSNFRTAVATKLANPSVWTDGDTVLLNEVNNGALTAESYCREGPCAEYRYFSAVLEEPGLVPAFPLGPMGGAVESVTRLAGWEPGDDPRNVGWSDFSVAPYTISTGSASNVLTMSADDTSTGYVQLLSDYTLTSADTHTLVVVPYHQDNNDGSFAQGYYYLRSWVDSTNYTSGYAYGRGTANGRNGGSLGSYDHGAAAAKNESVKTYTNGEHIWFARTEGRYCITANSRQAILYGLATATTGSADTSTIPVAAVQVGYPGVIRTNYYRGLGVYRLTMAS